MRSSGLGLDVTDGGVDVVLPIVVDRPPMALRGAFSRLHRGTVSAVEGPCIEALVGQDDRQRVNLRQVPEAVVGRDSVDDEYRGALPDMTVQATSAPSAVRTCVSTAWAQ